MIRPDDPRIAASWNTLANLLNEALPLWAKVTQTPLGKRDHHRIALGGSWLSDDYTLVEALADLNASREVDMSGWTTALLLRGWVDQMLDDAQVPLREVVLGTLSGLADVTRLVELTRAPVALHALASASEATRDAVAEFGGDLADVDRLVAQPAMLGDVRLNALRAVDQLTVHQFSRGARTQRPLRLASHVHALPSMGALVEQLTLAADATAVLAAVGDDADQACFAIGWRDGETVAVLTDREADSATGFTSRSRNPRRARDRRSSRHYFPYWLLEAEAGPEADARAISAARGQLGWPIHVLKSAEITWLLMVVGQLSFRVTAGDLEQPELAYAGDLVARAVPTLPQPSARALVPTRSALARVVVHQQAQVDLPALTVQTATAQAAETLPAVGHTAWIVDRYASDVPPGATDVANPGHVLAAGEATYAQVASPDLRRADDLAGDAHACEWTWQVRLRHSRGRLVLRALPSAYLATSRAQALREAAWLARHNVAQACQALARHDFDRHRDEVVAWYVAAVHDNPVVLQAAARQSWTLPTACYVSNLPSNHPEHEAFPDLDRLVWRDADVIKSYVRVGRGRYARSVPYQDYQVRLESGCRVPWPDGQPHHNKDGEWLCVHCATHHRRDSPRVASTVMEIRVDNYRAVATVTGVQPADLPWALQHYVHGEPYTGNSFLQRVDPVDEIDDPWATLDLRILIRLCRPCLNELRKAQGLAPLPASPRREAAKLNRKPALEAPANNQDTSTTDEET